MKIIVEGYQSIKKAEVELPEGKIVGITGRNNCGKTAFVRGIQAFIFNQSGTRFINNQLKKTRVAITTGRGSYSWVKNSGSAYYEIDGLAKRNINRQSLDEVQPNTGFIIEREGGNLIIPSIVNESSVIFPFNLTSSVAFKVFSRFVVTPKINGLIKELKQLIKDDRESIIKVNARLDQVETQLSKKEEEFKGFPNEEVVKRILSKIDEVLLAESKLNYVESRRDSLVKEKDLLEERRALCAPLSVMEGFDKAVENVKSSVFVYEDMRGKWDKLVVSAKINQDLRERGTALKRFVSHEEVVSKIKAKINLTDHATTLMGHSGYLGRTLTDIKNRIIEYERERGEVVFCPLCNQPLKRLDHGC